MDTKEIAEKYYLNQSILDKVIIQNEVPHSLFYGKICVELEQVDFILELYAKEIESYGCKVPPTYAQNGAVYSSHSNPTSYQQTAIESKLISSWGYIGYRILFGIPIIGVILLIVYSLDDSNINRRNFARSYWCRFLLIILFIVCIFALSLRTGDDYFAIILDALKKARLL